MEPGLAARRSEVRGRIDGVAPARPLVRPAPRSAMFFPLVVLVAVLPGLYALNNWDLTPPGPWWGMRALAVLDGLRLDQVPAADEVKPALEARAFRTVAFQPPLYAWLEAAGLALSADRDPRATVLPSYVAGVLVVVLVYLHGRLWRGPGLGLVAAVLTGFNRNLLVQMQQATPTTLALAGVLTALLCYVGHHRAVGESSRHWGWGGAAAWAAVGGLALGLSLLAVGLFGLVAVPVVVLHQAYLRAGSPPAERAAPWWRAGRDNLSLRAGGAALVLGLGVALPWYVWMYGRYGPDLLGALRVPFDASGGARPNLLARLIDLAPAAAPLGLFAAVRSIRLALTDETDDRAIVGGVFWVLWLGVAALAPAAWPTGPRPALDLALILPLNLLAAQAVLDLSGRQVPVRRLSWLAPATVVSVVWWHSDALRGAGADLAHGRASSATALGLHLALDLLVAVLWCTRRLDRWARRRDDRQRRVLGGYLAAVLAVTVVAGAREVRFRHCETSDLLMLRTMILRRDRERPFDLVAVVGPDGPLRGFAFAPGGRLRFILRAALPRLRQRDLTSTDALLTLPEGQRLVILAGTEKRPSYSSQARLGLEAIHPGRPGTLEAFATAHEPARPVRR